LAYNFLFKVKTLKKLLTELEVNKFIVVNGMTGCGKSSLVVEVLNDPFITMQYFQVNIFIFINGLIVNCKL